MHTPIPNIPTETDYTTGRGEHPRCRRISSRSPHHDEQSHPISNAHGGRTRFDPHAYLDGADLTTTLDVLNDGKYTVKLLCVDGFNNQTPIEYTIQRSPMNPT